MKMVLVDLSKPIDDPAQLENLEMIPAEVRKLESAQAKAHAEGQTIRAEIALREKREAALDAIAEGAPDSDRRIQAYRSAKG